MLLGERMDHSLRLYGWVVGKFISPLGFIWLIIRYLVYRFDDVLGFIDWYSKRVLQSKL